MKILTMYISWSALCNMLCGMEPTKQQSPIEPKAQLPPHAQRMSQTPRELTEHEMFMREVQAMFLQQSQEIGKRLDAWSKVDPRFDMNPILFDEERKMRVTFADVHSEKKND